MHAHSFFSFFFSFLFWIYDVTHQAFPANNQFRWFIDRRHLVTIMREAVHTEDATNWILLYFESNTFYESLLWVIIAAWQRENIRCLSFSHCYATFTHISWTSAFNILPCLSQRNFAHIFFISISHFLIFSEKFSSYTLSLFLIFATVPDTCPWVHRLNVDLMSKP